MNPLELEPEASEVLAINWVDRWQVYQRLQELEIPCWCGMNEPLRLQVKTVQQAIQLLSVLKQFTTSRQELVKWLEQCLHQS